MTLALHELVTNATKYGALSNETASGSLRWQVTDEEGAARFHLRWQEQGGPPVAPPTRRDFGSRMIEQSLRAYFRGDVMLEHPVEGGKFRIDAPLSDTGELVAA